MSPLLDSLKLPSFSKARKNNAARGGLRTSNKHKLDSGHLKNKQVTYLFRQLSTLIENGVSLPKALATLSEEKGTETYRRMLEVLRKRLENGESFSGALSHYPSTFDAVLISQVKVGERAGHLGESLRHLAEHREKAGKLRSEIIKKLTYPALLVIVGTAVITFLLTYVVPVFEQTYDNAKVPLPAITQALIAVGAFSRSYLLFIIGGIILTTVAIRQLRRNEEFAFRMDESLLKIPVVGPWLREMALLQMMEVLGDLLKAGFTLADALGEASESVTNRSAKVRVRELQKAVIRGERFSREMERHSSFFPPMVSQLVIIGEQTGMLTKSTRHICDHLSSEIERKATVFVAAIEPILTMTLAAAVAAVLMAIYLPMFDMINTVGK
ncbi:type II secretion system F family protein [Aeoliella mucimassa]|uniref:Type II secretion system protein F n=1 Tax=Aeoliella mucimassa TaxID=2527972 RepID=A0A518AQW8_9BACT|nr:type II secretion system F family protein [Aeoliella mucimassa]QDU57120.1 Type II secretion system protein F [Aeoliella mucimassa]